MADDQADETQWREDPNEAGLDEPGKAAMRQIDSLGVALLEMGYMLGVVSEVRSAATRAYAHWLDADTYRYEQRKAFGFIVVPILWILGSITVAFLTSESPNVLAGSWWLAFGSGIVAIFGVATMAVPFAFRVQLLVTEGRVDIDEDWAMFATIGGIACLLIGLLSPAGFLTLGVAGITSVTSVATFLLLYQATDLLIGRRYFPDLADEVVVQLGDCLSAAVSGRVIRELSGDSDPPGPRWRQDRDERLWLVHLLGTAGENLLTTASVQLQSVQGDTRIKLHDLVKRIAGGLANLSKAAWLGGAGVDNRLVESLAEGYVAGCQGRWSDLALMEPIATERRLLRTFIERGFVIGTLLLVAIAAPIVLEDDSVVAQVRGLCLSAGLLALTNPGKALTSIRDDVTTRLKGGSH